MIRRICTVILTFVISMSLCACQKLSVEDAEKINESHLYAYEKIEKETQPEGTGETVKATEAPVQSGKDKVTEINIGDTCSYNGYELTVKEVWLSKDLLVLDDIEGNSKFREFLVKQRNYGSVSLDENGNWLSGSSRSWLVIRMSLKREQDIKSSHGVENETICFSPVLYNKDSRGRGYSEIRSTEGLGFDCYKNIDVPDVPHKDSEIYSFEIGEQIETVMVMSVPDSVGLLEDVYMSTSFLLDGGTRTLEEGVYLVRLNIVDGEIAK